MLLCTYACCAKWTKDFPTEMNATLQLGNVYSRSIRNCLKQTSCCSSVLVRGCQKLCLDRKDCVHFTVAWWQCSKSRHVAYEGFIRSLSFASFTGSKWPQDACPQVEFPIRSCILVGKDALATVGIVGAISGPPKCLGPHFLEDLEIAN